MNEQRNGNGGLGLAGGAVDYRTFDSSKETGDRSQETEYEKESHAISFPHSPQNFRGLGNVALQCGHTVPGLAAGFTGAAAGAPDFTLSISSSTPANSFCKPILVC